VKVMPNDSPIVPKESYIKQIMPNRFDYLARFSGDSIGNLDLIAIRPTETFVSSFKDFLKGIGERESTLVEVIKKQKNLIDYNSYYISYLLNQISEDEFYKIAEDFAYSTQAWDESDIEKKTLLLLEKTGDSFSSSSDLSYLWGCSEEIIESVLKKLKANRSLR
jgi:hypothetical protein